MLKMERFFDILWHAFFFSFSSIFSGNMSPCWPSKSPKIAVWGASGRLLGALERPGGSVALPQGSGKVAGGFGRVPVRLWEVQERPGGRLSPGADFRSLLRGRRGREREGEVEL